MIKEKKKTHHKFNGATTFMHLFIACEWETRLWATLNSQKSVFHFYFMCK